MSARSAEGKRPSSTTGTLLERATSRPARVGIIALGAVALGAPMVTAEPAPLRPVPVAQSVAAAEGAPTVAHPGEGTINLVGQVAGFVAMLSAHQAQVTATSALDADSVTATTESRQSGDDDDKSSADADRSEAEEEAARQAEAMRKAAEKQAAEKAAREEAARREAEAQARAEAQAKAEAQARAEAAAPSVAPDSVWDSLAQCESGGNWSINTGNGYYGGLQFSLASWQGVGGVGYPHEASRETQIAMAERLLANGGWRHWPACSRKLGLR